MGLVLVLTAFLTFPILAQQNGSSRLPETDSAIVSFNLKYYEDAKDWALKATAKDPGAWEAWEVLGFSAQSLSDTNNMLLAGERLSQLLPEERTGWYLLLSCHYNQKRLDLAVVPMRKFCEVDPSGCTSSGIDQILASLSQDSLGLLDSVFRQQLGPIEVRLPKTWHSLARDDKSTLNWFVTLEGIESDSDAYSVGGAIRWVRNASSRFQIEDVNNTPDILTGLWDLVIDVQLGAAPKQLRNLIDSAAFDRKGWRGFIRTVEYQLASDLPKQRRRELVVARKDEVFAATFECVESNWLVYEPRFRVAIESLVLPD
jgi:hypothetical protein